MGGGDLPTHDARQVSVVMLDFPFVPLGMREAAVVTSIDSLYA